MNKSDFTIRKTLPTDIPEVMRLFLKGKAMQIKQGNPTQWPKGYPNETYIRQDMQQNGSYVLLVADRIEATMALLPGPDALYDLHLEGEWLRPMASNYGVIHRLCTSGHYQGLGRELVSFAQQQYMHLRMDTHPNNKSLHRLAEVQGFTFCGRIVHSNNVPSHVFEWVKIT